MSAQNLCVICCYSFEEKASRFISAEIKRNLGKFADFLGFNLPLSPPVIGGDGGGGSLNLPFGEAISVCGDCLSLVGDYVRRREAQKEKEEGLLELQRQVCKMIRELTGIVEEVEESMGKLKEQVRMGDGGKLEAFMGGGVKEKEAQARTFRDSILALNTGEGSVKRDDDPDPRLPEVEVIVKMDPDDAAPSWDSDWEDSYLPDANYDCPPSQNEVPSTSYSSTSFPNQDFGPQTPEPHSSRQYSSSETAGNPLQVTKYTSTTKSRVTYKIADSAGYTYHRRYHRNEGSYYRCDFRKGKCSAAILFKNGVYTRLQKGWDPSGLHLCHPPNVAGTQKKIAIGHAKHLYLTDTSKTVDEVCSLILNQTTDPLDPAPPVTARNLKRSMLQCSISHKT